MPFRLNSWLGRNVWCRLLLRDTAAGEVLDVKNVVFCTGFDPGLSFIELPSGASRVS